MGNKITNEQIEDVYINFKNYYLNNKSDFLEKKQKHIVDEIKQNIISKNKFIWNDVSLTDYINNLVYMIKGKQFARVINKFSKEYFIKNICKDFDTIICENAKKSIELHEIYYADVIAKNKAKINENNNGVTFEQTQDNEAKRNIIKNIILYGSPGVGKTHNTKKLISLIESGQAEKDIFETIKHNEQNNGIDAEENLLKSSEERKVSFKEAFNRVFKDKIENQESVKIDLKRADSFFKVNDFNDKTIYFEKQSGTTKHTLSISTLEKMYAEEKNSFINGGLAVYYEPILDKLLGIKRESVVEKVERKNYYLVIDEINRGNISKIFGELITLIEEDKRDTLEITLPYSKKTFKIPSNLYIIGTMNSTDKSIALIDIALRRRFTFLKMEPKLDLVDNVKAKNIMQRLNEKITDTLGADYVLGHSYFMKIENDDDLEFVLEYKIKPLLEEYFYGDKNRLDEVLKLW